MQCKDELHKSLFDIDNIKQNHITTDSASKDNMTLHFSNIRTCVTP